MKLNNNKIIVYKTIKSTYMEMKLNENKFLFKIRE